MPMLLVKRKCKSEIKRRILFEFISSTCLILHICETKELVSFKGTKIFAWHRAILEQSNKTGHVFMLCAKGRPRASTALLVSRSVSH